MCPNIKAAKYYLPEYITQTRFEIGKDGFYKIRKNTYGAKSLQKEKLEKEKQKMVETKKAGKFVNVKSFTGTLAKAEVQRNVWTDLNNEPRVDKEGKHIVLTSLYMEFEDVKDVQFYEGAEFEIQDGILKQFLGISQNCTEKAVTQESKIDKYLSEVEIANDVNRADFETYLDVVLTLEGKPFKYVNKKLGKDFDGKEGKSFYVPQVKL